MSSPRAVNGKTAPSQQGSSPVQSTFSFFSSLVGSVSSSFHSISERSLSIISSGAAPSTTSLPKPAETRDLSASTFSILDCLESNTPIKTRCIDKLILEPTKLEVKSFHVVNRATKRNSSALYYVKHNPLNSIISELEAVGAGFFRLIAPSVVTTTRALQDQHGQYCGVASKAHPSFKSLREAPLTLEDLNDKQLVANLATSLTTSYIFEEDDLHRGNMAKNGDRIDFDMLMWPILYDFKDPNIVDWTFRSPSTDQFVLTERDMAEFPNIKDTKPFYWPTNPPPFIKEPLRSALLKVLPLSSNAYKEEENNIFKKLETNDTFIYHKFKTLLKFALTDEKMYRSIASLHMRNTLKRKDDEDTLIDRIVKHQMQRVEKVKSLLISMEAFHDFIMEHGKQVMTDIVLEFEAHNHEIERKKVKHDEYKNLEIPIEEIKKRCLDLCTRTIENPNIEAMRKRL